MATVHIVLGHCVDGLMAGVRRLAHTAVDAADTVTSSAASAQADITAPAGNDGIRFWSVTATGGDVYLAFGADPTAAAGADWLVLDGQTREWAAAGGDKVAVIDA